MIMNKFIHTLSLGFISFLLIYFLNATWSFGQVPKSFAYQFLLTDTSGTLIANEEIEIKLSILSGSAIGSAIYKEKKMVTTNSLGLVNMEVGSENPAAFDTINWANGPYFLSVAVNGKIMGTSQLLSVPYALYASSAKTDEILKSMGILPKNYAGTITDIEGNIYKTITIGTLTWMAENIRTGSLNDNTPIPLVKDDATWGALSEPAYCWYENNAGYSYTSVEYGALYNWYTVNTGKLCPSGWHVLNASDYTTLIDFLGETEAAGIKLMETGSKHWITAGFEGAATNETGFTALPGGMRNFGGAYELLGISGFWWSVVDNSPSIAYMWSVLYDHRIVNSIYDKKAGLSVRCLKD
jgi:uncharacterized protein (TIGR02145 family)